jgi:hypothetical protein
MKGLDQFKHPTMNTLPLVLRGASKIGWYEGSGFFIIMSTFISASSSLELQAKSTWYLADISGILNYKWSQTGIYDIYDKSIAGILTGMMAAAGAAYYRSNDRPTAFTLAVVALLQGLGVRNGWYSGFA